MRRRRRGRGRNALRAVELMNIGWDFRREQPRPDQRSHYVITNGGDQPNVIPPLASVWYFFRELDFENIKRNYEIGNKIAEAAAMMTDTKVTRKLIGAAAPRHFNKPMAEAVQANIDKVGLPQWTPDEQILPRRCSGWWRARRAGLPPPPARWRRRRLGRKAAAPTIRRRILGGADHHVQLSGQYPQSARPQLVERHRDGNADRP